jgi:hypothetical protein
MLALALKAGLPLIHVRTDDVINVEEVLSFIAEEPFRPLLLPAEIGKISDLKVPSGRLFYTSSECKSLRKLYHFCVDNEITIVFVNTEKSVLHFDGGALFPPKELVLKWLQNLSNDADTLLPAFGGMTLKDVGEVAKLTMTRDASLTCRGVNDTRRGYNNLRGISPVDTQIDYYVTPSYLEKWMSVNSTFFMKPVHASLTPRGLLFDGPPGTGKTMASKHIAAQFGIPLYRIDVGAMKGKYVGESEGNLLAALSQVDQVEPCVVILDEVEKIFQTQGDSGVTSSMLSQLLWWLAEHKTKVFTVMTTNDITKIPAELYREGRIDATMSFLGIETAAEGVTFGSGVMSSMLASIGSEADPADYVELAKRLTRLFQDGNPVPQAKIAQDAYAFVRELMAKG